MGSISTHHSTEVGGSREKTIFFFRSWILTDLSIGIAIDCVADQLIQLLINNKRWDEVKNRAWLGNVLALGGY